MKMLINIDAVRYDLYLALRSIRKFDASVLLVVLTLSIGLAAAMTGYGVMASLSRLPVNVRTGDLYIGWVNSIDSDVDIYHSSENKNAIPSHIAVRDARYLLATKYGVASWVTANATQDIATDGVKANIAKDQTVLLTSSQFITSLGIRLVNGRSWNLSEEEAGAPVAVIDTFLARRLLGPRMLIGQNIFINNHPFRVIGIVEPFKFSPHFYELDEWTFSADQQERVLIPYSSLLNSSIVPDNKDLCDTDNTRQGKVSLAFDANACQWLTFWINLKSDSEASSFKEFLEAYQKTLSLNAPINRAPRASLYELSDWLIRQHVVPSSIRLSLLMSAGFLLLCIVSASGVLTARLARDSKEIAIRRALGATKLSIFRRYIFHSLALSIISGLIAIPMLLFGFFLAKKQMPDASNAIYVDGIVALYMIAVTLVSGIGVGVVPAMRNAGEQLASVLNRGEQ